MPLRLDSRDPGFDKAFANLLIRNRKTEADVNDVAAAIIANVQNHGDKALIDYTRRLDRLELTPETLRVSPEEITAALGKCSPETLDALKMAAERILDYHARQMPENQDYTDAAGIRLGHRWKAVEAAGLYVPGGTAAYPSSVLMNALPAKVAGVERVVMATPAPGGVLNPLVLAAAHISGVREIYRIGGAQAVAALAFGTESICPVVKIVGPGNAYVAAAKRQVFGVVGIDMIAGPSEVLVIADGLNDPSWIAADLISQAEHDVAAQPILITDDDAFAEAVVQAADKQLATLPRAEIARESWERQGCIITVGDVADSAPLINQIAPEHLELAVSDPDALAEQVRNAGAIFMGRFSPEAVGDYVAGPNHVLPTARTARFSSPLGVLDFLKRSSIIACSAEGLAAIGPSAMALAKAEGLDGHRLSVSMRLNRRK